MSATKYKQYYTLMATKHEPVLTAFKVAHDAYQADPKNSSVESTFHQQGHQVVRIMRDWERRLCSGMERGNNSVYSARLAEKFWEEIKKEYPLIDKVGVKTSYQK